MELKFNPFGDEGIVNLNQFENYPFIMFKTLDLIEGRINQQIKQIKNKFHFGERLILIGDRGIGKSSTLFYLRSKLKKEGINAEVFSRLFEDTTDIVNLYNLSVSQGVKRTEAMMKVRKDFNSLTSTPLYILVDFPDAIETKNLKKFLENLWSLMTHRNYNKINLIFAMNHSHYNKAFSLSETFGKFTTIRLEKLDFDSSVELIASRLKLVEKKVEEVFLEDSLLVIYSYSKGIPRNLISACNLIFTSCNGSKITKELCEDILKEKYLSRIINDRVESAESRRIFTQMVEILEKKFKGISKSKEDYVREVVNKCNIGRNTTISRINDLVKFGIFREYRAGENRTNKVLSLI